MTGIGVGVVFCILVVLVFVLQIFNMVAKPSAPKAQAAPLAQPLSSASEEDKAAVAVALHLYMGCVHDEESHVLTIHNDAHPAWHAELNPEL